MKKILMSLLFIIILVGCGKSKEEEYSITTEIKQMPPAASDTMKELLDDRYVELVGPVYYVVDTENNNAVYYGFVVKYVGELRFSEAIYFNGFGGSTTSPQLLGTWSEVYANFVNVNPNKKYLDHIYYSKAYKDLEYLMNAGVKAAKEYVASSDQTTSTKTVSSKVPREHRSALKKAKMYAETMNMSKNSIYDQLVSEYGENFPKAAAEYAIENIKFDWKNNALKKARMYAETMDMSNSAIYDQLVSEYGEKFTREEARYAIDNLD